VVYFVFDLLYLDGYDLRGASLSERRKLLEQVVTPGGVLRSRKFFPGAGAELLEAARENGLEGMMAKHASSVYESRRSREWLKIKITGNQEFVIGGFTAPGRRALALRRAGLGSTTKASCTGWATWARVSTRSCWHRSTRSCAADHQGLPVRRTPPSPTAASPG
jgi:bifunctional non-homologous end joining protein LigD